MIEPCTQYDYYKGIKQSFFGLLFPNEDRFFGNNYNDRPFSIDALFIFQPIKSFSR